MSILKNIKRYLPDWFIFGIVLMIVLAYFFPGLAAKTRVIDLHKVGKIAIMLLFFFYGLKMEPAQLVSGLKNWRMHITIQAITFVLFPLLVLIFYPFFAGTQYFTLWLAMFFLAALPGTVSSSVVMVSIARGNVAGAIFNAGISGVIGIVITPMWIALFFGQASGGTSFGSTLLDLVVQILLPFLAGLFLHRFFGKYALKYKHIISVYDKCVIFLIVYRSFGESFLNGVFESVTATTLLVLSGAVVALFFTVYFLSGKISQKLKFSRNDKITVIFCGSKKSLVHGSVMASVLFAGNPAASLFLVPIMIFHAFQLLYISVVAQKMGNKIDTINMRA